MVRESQKVRLHQTPPCLAYQGRKDPRFSNLNKFKTPHPPAFRHAQGFPFFLKGFVEDGWRLWKIGGGGIFVDAGGCGEAG
ncbi:hypothetical protein L211DRAFT_833586 [Terfezia boudieri ATCC MYA-4762]|uniref:Uncharacterized protein n=1 Tax=Terfezia boudieri ATCC MYA-4762 TaxID=1051890 RepID=A0A3N4M0C3_9PEZI|nr:hypothetical protein L211DRAFT_833586 [Terfezia boudieri ATCC MYA-4762]